MRQRQRRVQLDVGQVGEPHERGPVLGERVVDRTLLHGLDPLGPVRGRLLLVEVLAVDAVGIALEGQRAVVQVREHDRRDPGVVRDEVALGEPRLGVQDLVPVGDLQPPPLGQHANAALGQLLDLVEQGLRRARVDAVGGVLP